jgi:predicted MFS family arabinose efflux permease
MAMCGTMTLTSIVAGRTHARDPRARVSNQAFAVALAILCVGVGNLWIGMAAIILFGLPHAFYNATQQAWVADRFAAHGQGAVMGLLSTTFCVANIVMAFGGGLLAQIDTRLVLITGGLLTGWAALSMRRWSRETVPTHQEFA